MDARDRAGMAPTPAFMTALFGSALACAVLSVWGVLSLDGVISAGLLTVALTA